jgi:hypothetical protein
MGASLVGVALAAGSAIAFTGPARADWGGCYSWIESDYAKGRCANVNRQWRVWVDCRWPQNDWHSGWVRQQGGDITTQTKGCGIALGPVGSWVEEKPL